MKLLNGNFLSLSTESRIFTSAAKHVQHYTKMQTRNLLAAFLVIVLISCFVQDAEATFKLKKLIKAGIILKALSPKRTILPIPIPIPM